MVNSSCHEPACGTRRRSSSPARRPSARAVARRLPGRPVSQNGVVLPAGRRSAYQDRGRGDQATLPDPGESA